MKIIKVNQMKIGDVVKLANMTGPYNHSTVVKIDQKENSVTLFRPYVRLNDFTYSGGVIPYVGTETYSIWITSPMEYILLGNIFRPSEAEIKSENSESLIENKLAEPSQEEKFDTICEGDGCDKECCTRTADP